MFFDGAKGVSNKWPLKGFDPLELSQVNESHTIIFDAKYERERMNAF